MSTDIATLEQRINRLEGLLAGFIKSDRYVFQKDLQFLDGRHIQLSKGTGTKIGTEASQKLAFFGETPVIQQTFAGETIGMTTPASDPVLEASAFGGGVGTAKYTIHGIVDALKNIGILAKS